MKPSWLLTIEYEVARPRPLPLLLGGEIGVEDPRQVLRRGSPRPSPSRRSGRISRRRGPAGCPPPRTTSLRAAISHRAPERHRLAGVEHEILDHLGQLPLVGVHRPQVLGRRRAGSRTASRSTRTSPGLPGSPASASVLFSGWPPLANVSSWVVRFTDSVEGLFGLLEHRPGLVAASEVHLRQRDVPEQALQQVVEIVGDPAGQGPDRLELLGFDQLAARAAGAR